MSLRTSAARYARVLLEVAVRESDPSAIERDLASFAGMLSGHGELKRVLLSPGIPTGVRREIVEALVSKAGYAPPLAKLLVLLADRGRLELVPDLLDVYRDRMLAHQNVVRGSVATAAPLLPGTLQALERSLSSATGKQVQLAVTTDPALIGGVVARIGSTVYDGSIRTQLQKMKQRLIETA